MALSYVGYASAASASVALPAFTAGDLAIVFAYRDGSNTAPSLPGGWTNRTSAGGTSNSFRVGYRVLQASDTTTSVWTNATEIQVLVLRGQHPTAPLGTDQLAFNGSGTSITYTAPLTLNVTDGSSWIVGLAGHRTATDVLSRTVTGMTTRSSGGAATSLGAHTEQAAAWATGEAFTVNASSAWRSYVAEVVAAAPKQTGTAEISLAAAQVPTTRTGHVVNIRARKTNAAHAIVLRAQLYEGATARSAVLETALTTTLADYPLAVADADAATIGSYANLSVRVWGYSTVGDAGTVEVANLSFSLPSAGAGSRFGAVDSPFTFGVSTSGQIAPTGTKTTGTFEVSLEPALNPATEPGTDILDDFTRADTGPPPSGSWGNLALAGSGGLKVVSNQLAAHTADSAGYWNTSFGAAQEAYLTIGSLSAAEGYRGLFLRLADPTGSPNGYFFELDRDTGATDEMRLYRLTGGAFTQLGATVAREFAAGDSIWFRAFGTTLVGYHRVSGDTVWTEVLRVTDSTYTAAGYAGVFISDTGERLDSFGGGELVSTANIVVRARKTNGAHVGTVRVQLFEGTTPRSAELETGALTTSLADYTVQVAASEAAAITDYSNLSLRVRGYASTGTATVFEIAQLQLSLAAAANIPAGQVTLASFATITVGDTTGVPVYPGAAVYPHGLITLTAVSTITAISSGVHRYASVTAPFVLGVSTSGQKPNAPFGAAVLASTATISVTAASAGAVIGRVLLASTATIAATSRQAATGTAAIASTATITVGADFTTPPAPPGFTRTLPSLPDHLYAIAFDSQPLSTTQLYEGITEDTRQVDTRRGRQFELDRFEAGSGYILLDNLDGKFNPENTASPYYPNLKPTRRMRIRVSWASTTYDLFTGFLEGYPQEYRYAGNDRIVSQNAVDLFMALAVARFIPAATTLTSTMAVITEDTTELISASNTLLPMPQAVPFNITIGTETMSVTEIVAGSQYRVARTATGSAVHGAGDALTTDAVSFPQQYTGARIQAVLDYIGVAVTSDLDAGQTLLAPSDNLAGQSPLEHIQLVAEAEQGRFFAAGDGTLTFQGRHRFYADEKTSRATFGDAGGTEIGYNNPKVTHDDAKLYNIVRITPANGATFEARDEASIQDHFERVLEKQWPLADYNEAKDAAEYLLARLSRMQLRIPEMDLFPQNRPTTVMPVVLGLEIGQRYDFKLRPKDGSQIIDKTLVVEGVSHRLTPDTMQTQVQLSLADTTHYWQLEVAGYSELGTTTKLTY